MLYHNDSNFEVGPFYLDLPGCAGNCSLTSFEAIIHDVLPGDNFATLCRGYVPDLNMPLYVCIASMVFLILFIMMFKFCLCDQFAGYRKKKDYYPIGVWIEYI